MINQGDIINEYSLEIFQDKKVEKEKETHKVISIVEHEKRGRVIAITDDYFGIQVIQTIKDRDKLSVTLNNACVWERKWSCKSLIDSIHAVLYTTQNNDKKVYEKLKKEIAKFIEKEYGKYCNYKMILDNIEI
jgi:hypothetical protein